MLVESRKRRIWRSKSPIAFAPISREAWYRYITIDGRTAFEIGNVCGTCDFYFTRFEGANRSIDPKEVAHVLNAGTTSLDPGFLSKLEQIIPAGDYRVMLMHISPLLVSPGDENDYFSNEQKELWNKEAGDPHSPKTEYYRLNTRSLPNHRGLFEFLVPTFPLSSLSTSRVAQYVEDLKAGKSPTGVALSVFDVKAPGDWEGEPGIVEHLCLAHYLIDGHHKVYAAAASRRPMSLVSYLAVDQGVSFEKDIEELLKLLEKA